MITPIALIHATVYGMMDRGFGRIINITSYSVKSPVAQLELSNGARCGLTGAVAVLARRSAAHNVTINALLPGPFDTDRLRGTSQKMSEASGRQFDEVHRERMQDVPAKRFDPGKNSARWLHFWPHSMEATLPVKISYSTAAAIPAHFNTVRVNPSKAIAPSNHWNLRSDISSHIFITRQHRKCSHGRVISLTQAQMLAWRTRLQSTFPHLTSFPHCGVSTAVRACKRMTKERALTVGFHILLRAHVRISRKASSRGTPPATACRESQNRCHMKSLSFALAIAAITFFSGLSSTANAGWRSNLLGTEASSRAAAQPRRASKRKARTVRRKTRSRRVRRQRRSGRRLARGTTLRGLASFYWQPQRVAAGGWFNPNALTAAHKTLRFGTRVLVTNLRNGRSVVVRINDRGPYIRGRIIDLSRARRHSCWHAELRSRTCPRRCSVNLNLTSRQKAGCGASGLFDFNTAALSVPLSKIQTGQ